MIIDKYVSYFHDGLILGVKNVSFFIESAEVDEEEVKDLPLTKDSTLKGFFIIENVKNFDEINRGNLDFLSKNYQICQIAHLDVCLKRVLIEILVFDPIYQRVIDYLSIDLTGNHIINQSFFVSKSKVILKKVVKYV